MFLQAFLQVFHYAPKTTPHSPSLPFSRSPTLLMAYQQRLGSVQGNYLGDSRMRTRSIKVMTHLSSIRTQRSLNCLWRWCLCCFLCHFFCRPNSSSWLILSGNRRWGDRLSSSSICWGFREGDVSGTCSESWRAGRAVAEDPSKAGLVFVVLELQNVFKHLVNTWEAMLRKGEDRGLHYLVGAASCWGGVQGERLCFGVVPKHSSAFPRKLPSKHQSEKGWRDRW